MTKLKWIFFRSQNPIIGSFFHQFIKTHWTELIILKVDFDLRKKNQHALYIDCNLRRNLYNKDSLLILVSVVIIYAYEGEWAHRPENINQEVLMANKSEKLTTLGNYANNTIHIAFFISIRVWTLWTNPCNSRERVGLVVGAVVAKHEYPLFEDNVWKKIMYKSFFKCTHERNWSISLSIR